MAKKTMDTDQQSRDIIRDLSAGKYKPIYLLMGDESYYPDKICDYMTENVIDLTMRDFNQLVFYGTETDIDTVIDSARRYPMMADYQLVVLKEAQAIKDLNKLDIYCKKPLDSTILVILYHGNLDKRKSLYKTIRKIGEVVDSQSLRDYQMSEWISAYFRNRGLEIDPNAASLFAESAGTDLSKIAVETDKLLKNLKEGQTQITVKDIETNVGISREFSIFELTKALSYGDRQKSLHIATYIGMEPKFAMPMAVSALFTHFNRILKYGALLAQNHYPSKEEKSKVLVGVNPYFYREYDAAIANYPLPICMKVINILKEYDFRGKGGEGETSTQDQLLIEMVCSILNSRYC